jgi:hypothetical protein
MRDGYPSPARDLDLPRYAAQLVEDATAASGASLAVMVAREGLEFDSDLALATDDAPLHILRYGAALHAFRTHFLVSAATKIQRVFSLPPPERLVASVPTSATLPRPYLTELRHKLAGQLPLPVLTQYARLLRTGLTRQLISFPLDLRVEREVHATLPEHRRAQEAYLAYQVEDFLPTLQEGLRSCLPDALYTASCGMNIAFAETAARLAGVVPDPVVRAHPARPVAEQLLHALADVRTPGYAGDRELTDRWADTLNLRSWYAWTPLSP